MTGLAPRVAPVALALAAVLAALAPLLGPTRNRDTVQRDTFPGWPAHFEDRALKPLPLTPREALFVRDFPGRVGRFEDGRRDIIVRWVSAPTRLLHPAADCFRGVGYAISPLPARRSPKGEVMSWFRATRGAEEVAPANPSPIESSHENKRLLRRNQRRSPGLLWVKTRRTAGAPLTYQVAQKAAGLAALRSDWSQCTTTMEHQQGINDAGATELTLCRTSKSREILCGNRNDDAARPRAPH